MALLEDVTKGLTSPTALAVGIGTLIISPVVVPVVSSMVRPLAKAVLSTGIGVYRQTMEPLSRAMTELVSEARQELAASSSGAVAGTEPVPGEGTPARPSRRGGKSAEGRTEG